MCEDVCLCISCDDDDSSVDVTIISEQDVVVDVVDAVEPVDANGSTELKISA